MAEVELSDGSSIVFVVARVATHMNVVIRPKIPFEAGQAEMGIMGCTIIRPATVHLSHCLKGTANSEVN